MDTFLEGGIGMWGVLCMTLIAFPISIVAAALAFSKKSRGGALGLSGAAILFSLLTVLIGLMGYLYGMSQVEVAVGYAEPSSRDLMLEMGRSEAMANIWCGLIGMVLPLLLGAAGLIRAFTLKPTEAGTRGD